MSGLIPQHFIDDLMARVDIVDIIDSHVSLKKAGRDYTACCPFHNEKTPSFTVSRDKQFYHCFGCGAHGTAISFLMNYSNMDFVEAVHELASRAGMTVPDTNNGKPSRAPVQTDRYEVLQQCANFYRRQLRTHPQGQQAIAYLKQRGLTGEIAADFGLGYAPPGWDSLLGALGQDKAKILLETGMLISKASGRPYDRFRDRIMFPIRDNRGRVIGFGGRVLGDETPKYLNSPETPVYHKGRELYGLFEARRAVRNLERLLVVEGYMDVIMLARHGIRYAVATLGTATTGEHLERMFRIVPEIVFCFDGDRAGRAAAWRALENTMPLLRDGRQARFLFLPDGEDPDSLVRQEKQSAFEKRVVNAVTLPAFFYDELRARVDSRDIDGHARLVELARPLLSNMPASVFKQEMVSRLAERAGISERDLWVRMESRGASSGTRGATARGAKEGTEDYHRKPSLMRAVISLLLRHPALAAHAGPPDELRTLPLPGAELLADVVELLTERPHLTSAALVEHWRNTEYGVTLARLAVNPVAGIATELDPEKEFIDAMQRLRSQCRERRLEALLDKAQSGTILTDSEKDEIKQLSSSNVAVERMT